MEQILTTLISLNAINICVIDSLIGSMRKCVSIFCLDISPWLKNIQFLLKQWVMIVFLYIVLCVDVTAGLPTNMHANDFNHHWCIQAAMEEGSLARCKN